MREFDYIVVGAGSAGCVLADRLSADGSTSVLLLEAGGRDKNPMIRVPKGFGKLLGDPRFVWHLPTQPFGPTDKVEHWVRGKVLGGSSSVNGMVYNRGSQADWDSIEALGNPGWGWSSILPLYREMEDNELGASDVRGVGGPLHVSTARDTDVLCDEVIEAGAELGMRRVDDLNASDDERIGYTMATIRRGRRVSAADAFLHPAESRPNLTVSVSSLATRLLFDGDRVTGVEVRRGGDVVRHRAAREVILCLGSLQTPHLLQLSGIGPADDLRAAGVDVRLDQPNVGARMREHRCFVVQYRLNENLGYNRLLHSKLQQNVTGAKYLVTRRGPLAAPAYDVIGFLKTRPDLDRPDAQLLMGPFSAAPYEAGGELGLEAEPGVQCIGFISRPDSEGRVRLVSDDPTALPSVTAEYYTTDHDRRVGLGLFRKMRELFAAAPIAKRIDHETLPGNAVVDDQAIIDSALEHGYCGYHAIGTCAMGASDHDVVDAQLRVRGVEGLRVMDASVLPVMVSGNLNGPVMVMAARLAQMLGADDAGSNMTMHLEDLADPTFDPYLSDEGVFGDILDPYARIAALRAQAPVIEADYRAIIGIPTMPSDAAMPHCTVLSFAGVDQILNDPVTFSNRSFAPTLGAAFGHTVSVMDPPEHTRYRRILQQAFRPAVVQQWGADIVGPVVDELLGAFRSEGRAELVEQFARPYPFTVIYRMLGLPSDEIETFYKLTVAQIITYPDMTNALDASAKLGRYFAALLDERRADPGTDIVSVLATTEVDGEPLPDDVAISFLRQLINAGGDTTFRTTSVLLTGLLTNPEQLDAVRADRSLVAAAIEEALRWDGPVLASSRLATVDAVVDGVRIPEGAFVDLLYGAANHDPAVFPEPERFDIFRPKHRHFGFAFGIHNCLGQALARLEMTRALHAVLDGLPGLRLDPEYPVPHPRGALMRTPKELRVVFD